ncbi:MAG: hypothetical protein FWE53_02065 [Firmicutes bacterium]|nr:hypothetical protein [Bacillota bacterium]
MWEEIVTLFTEIDILPAVLLLLGLALCIIEMCMPGFGVFGISGAISIVGGLIALIAYGNSVTQFFIMLFIILVILAIMFLIAIYSAKRGLLSKTPLITSGTAVSADYGSPEKNFGKLLGKEGVLSKDCKPVGRVMIADLEYEVTTKTAFLIKGTRVQVIEVEGATITVKAI